MPHTCLYFQVHQPNRLIPYDFFRIGQHAFYEDDGLNAEVLSKVAEKCYLPTNALFKRIIEQTHGRFRMTLSISGTVIEQMQHHRPDVLKSFQDLVATGSVELLAETYYHSLAILHSKKEFERQVERHLETLESVFHVRPRVFRNTELIYNNAIAAQAETMGFDGIMAEGVPWVLNGQSPNHVYRAPYVTRLKTLLRNSPLSDDLGFRFSDKNWSEWPLTPRKFAGWVKQAPGDVVNLFMDYETIGEHQWEATGIFNFFRHLPEAIWRHSQFAFLTPSQVVDAFEPAGEIDVPHMISWADTERDLPAWLGNAMQSNALHELYKLEGPVKATGDPKLIDDWRRLTTSDHFYYMCTKYFADGDVHKYFNPYESPYDSYINFMNVLDNLRTRAEAPKDATR